MDENIDMDKYLQESTACLQQCKTAATEIRAISSECNNVILLNTITETVLRLQAMTTGIYDFYNVQVPNTAVTTRDKFKLLVDCNDTLLDKLALDLEDASGKRATMDIDEITDKSSTRRGTNSTSSRRVTLTPKRIDKPQDSFQVKVDNSPHTPFLPILTEKPNSKKPLSVLLCLDQAGREYYNHPYYYELQIQRDLAIPKRQLKTVTPIKSKVFEDTPLMVVETVEELTTAVAELSQCKQIAVDLEHNSFRSYLGLTCLLQISSRSKDYIVDTLKLRGHLEVLNEIFTNPNILKVFHGASCDILWLQRDLGVYVVNMFDTFHAARLLDYPYKSLAHLLTKFCGIFANKLYQRADWRVRPLPADFIKYARQDTHYLLYIFDEMRNELIEKDPTLNLIKAVYASSTDSCLERYEKPFVDEESYMTLYIKSRVAFNSRQRYALQKIFQWRDETARKVDESVEYVLAAHMMLQISEQLPKEVQGILALCNPVPIYVKSYKLVLHNIILDARKLPLEEVENVIYTQKQEKSVHSYELKMDFLSKFDFSRIENNQTELSTILTDTFGPNASYRFDKASSSEVVGMKNSNFLGSPNKRAKYAKGRGEWRFDTPFERYEAMSSIQKLLNEGREKAKSTSNEDRVNQVLDFLGTLSIPDVSKSSEENETSEEDSVQIPTTENQNNDQLTTKTEPRGKKRILKAVITENRWKALRPDEDLPANFDHINENKRSKAEIAEDNGITDSSTESFKPFDYASANTSFLKPTKKTVKEKVTERYKGKRNQAPTGLKKSGLKSFSWGASK